MKVSSITRLVVLVAAAGLLGGSCVPSCVQFEGQNVVVRHNDIEDTLDVLLVYRGLHGSGADTEAVVNQLEAARDHRVFALLSSWSTFDLDGVLSKEPPSEPLAAIRTGLRNMEVHDLGTWLDADGRLCSAQHLHLQQAGQALTGLSGRLVAWLAKDGNFLQELAKGCGLDDGDLRALHDNLHAESDFPLVELRGSALVLSLPLDESGWHHLRATALKALDEMQTQARAGDAQSRTLLDLLVSLDVTLGREGDRVLLVLGNPGRDESAFEIPGAGPADAKLVDALRAKGWTLDGGEAAARKAFDEATIGQRKASGHHPR